MLRVVNIAVQLADKRVLLHRKRYLTAAGYTNYVLTIDQPIKVMEAALDVANQMIEGYFNIDPHNYSESTVSIKQLGIVNSPAKLVNLFTIKLKRTFTLCTEADCFYSAIRWQKLVADVRNNRCGVLQGYTGSVAPVVEKIFAGRVFDD